jgi:hypothetical protein
MPHPSSWFGSAAFAVLLHVREEMRPPRLRLYLLLSRRSTRKPLVPEHSVSVLTPVLAPCPGARSSDGPHGREPADDR